MCHKSQNGALQHIRPLYVNFGGTFFCFLFGSECGTAQFSLFLFPLIPAAAYVHLDAWCDPYCIVEVDNFWFGLFPSVAQLSSDFHYFSCFSALADIVIDVDGLDNILPSWSSSTSTSMAMIFLTNQRPRKCDMTERKNDRMTFWLYDDQCPPGSGRNKIATLASEGPAKHILCNII